LFLLACSNAVFYFRKKQLTMSEFVQRKNPPCTPQQAAIVTDAILSMLVTDMRPLSMVEDEGFKKMVSILNPGYILPSRTHFTKLMERKYQEALQKIKSAINTTNSRMALTTDIWTNVSTEAYLGITCHYIGNDWKMTSICLTTMPLEGRHTSTNIAEWLEEVAVKFEIPFEKICAIVHDNGANVVAAAKLLQEKHGWTSVRCTGHTLQLVINAALKNTGIQRAVGAARCLVEHFKKSEQACSKLKEKQKQMGTPEHKLVQDVSTRWNSTFYMIQSLIEQKRALGIYVSEKELPDNLTAHQWALLEKIVTVLGPFEELTRKISSYDAMAADLIPAVTVLQRFLSRETDDDQGIKTMKGTLAAAVRRRFSDVEEQPLYSIATLLDPR